MTTTRLARLEDLAFLAGIEDAGDTLFAERFGGVDWPAASTGEERAAEPGRPPTPSWPVAAVARSP